MESGRQDWEDPAYAKAMSAMLRHMSGSQFVSGRVKRLGVAVSGGSDSMALLDLMHWSSREYGFELFAVTVDHGLRAEAREEAARVSAYCTDAGISHDVLVWDGWDGRGNLQGRARRARYELIAEWAKSRNIDRVALGHTEDDQAETVVMRLARKSGVDGLSAMERRVERDGVTWVRPLLAASREDLRVYLRSQKISWSEDPSNEDDTFERVRARKALATLNEAGVNAQALASVASNAQSARWALEHYAWREVMENPAIEIIDGDIVFPENFLTPEGQIPYEVGRRLMSAAFRWISGAEYPPRQSAFIEMDAAMIDTDKHTLGGCFVTRLHGERPIKNKLRITREYNTVKDHVTPTDVLWDGRWVLDGPHSADLEIRALGEALKEVPDWRKSGVPRVSLLASPSVWRGDELVSAPLAGFENGWTAKATGRGRFSQFLLSR